MLNLDWQALADPAATLAIYMGRSVARQLAHQLMTHGLPGETPVMIASSVSLPEEQLVHTRLDLLGLVARSIPADTPVLLLIGSAAEPSVVGRHHVVGDVPLEATLSRI